LRLDFSTWLRKGADAARIRLSLDRDPDFDLLSELEPSGTILQKPAPVPPYRCGVDLIGESLGVRTHLAEDLVAIVSADEPVVGAIYAVPFPDTHVWSRRPGWFAASYGPFRRFAGGDPEWVRLSSSHPQLARHLTVFGEGYVLAGALEWMKDLCFQTLEANAESSRLFDSVKEFINQHDFLPYQVQLKKVSSQGVTFTSADGAPVDVAELGDGYRSVLSLTFELIRQLALAYLGEEVFERQGDALVVRLPGVVLIDEIDAHLHPTWQRRIGHWFVKHFPRVQFIVTTHSPLVCQAAEHGSIYRLAAPGSDLASGMVLGADRDRLIYGDILDAYGTEMFGQQVERSESGKEKLSRLAELNQKAIVARLTQEEEREKQSLQRSFPFVSKS
jgi:hypothetical protein